MVLSAPPSGVTGLGDTYKRRPLVGSRIRAFDTPDPSPAQVASGTHRNTAPLAHSRKWHSDGKGRICLVCAIRA